MSPTSYQTAPPRPIILARAHSTVKYEPPRDCDIIVAMPQFVIEREIPGAGTLTPEEFHRAAQRSVEVLRELGPQIQWIHSYVTDNKVYCIYLAPDEKIIQEHARKAGVPANRVSAVRRLLDPTAAE